MFAVAEAHGHECVDAVANGGGDRLDQRPAGGVRVDGHFFRCRRRGQKAEPEADRRLRDIEVDVPVVVALRELPEAAVAERQHVRCGLRDARRRRRVDRERQPSSWTAGELPKLDPICGRVLVCDRRARALIVEAQGDGRRNGRRRPKSGRKDRDNETNDTSAPLPAINFAAERRLQGMCGPFRPAVLPYSGLN